jgi:hypothetical protein
LPDEKGGLEIGVTLAIVFALAALGIAAALMLWNRRATRAGENPVL